MRFRLLHTDCRTALMVLAVAALGCVTARAGKHGEKIEFSEPSSPVMASNLNRLDPNPGTFKQMEADLFKPFQSLNPGNSLEGVITPLPGGPQRNPKAAPDRRTQEMMDKRRNWAFTSYEDLFPQPTLEEAFGIKQYGADGKELQTTSVVDRYYEKLEQKNSGATNRAWENPDLTGTAEFYNQNGFNPLGQSFAGGDPFMQKMFSAGHEDGLKAAEKTMSMFAKPDSTLTPAEETLAQQQRLDDFKRALRGDMSVRPAKTDGFGAMLGLDDYAHPGNPAGQNLIKEQLQKAAEPRSSVLNQPVFTVQDPTANALHSHINDDLTARALGLPNPAPKVVEPPKPPTAQSVEAVLDPFAAGRMRRKF